MHKDRVNDALRYLLNELDADSRALFEREMATDPAVATVVKCVADTLARYACEAAPARAMDPLAQHLALSQIIAATATPQTQPAATPLRRWMWPLAACLLLLLNLWQLLHPFAPPSVSTGGKAGADRTTVAEVSDRTGTAGDHRGDVAGSAPHAEGKNARVTIGVGELRRLRETQAKFDRLGKAYARLQGEHDVLVDQLIRLAGTGKGVARLSMMELADQESYAAGRRKGLLNLALNVLTEPGIIALEPDGSISSGSGNGNPAPPNPADDPGAANTVPGADDPTNPTATGDADPNAPYAWSVYDDAQARGFLNLYNLPEPAASDALQLWVKLEDGGSYVRVGEVPEHYYGGSGSIAYALPGVLHAPTEILITSEPRGQVPAQPAGTTVLRGP